MSTATDSELRRTARLLGVEGVDVEYLRRFDAAAIRGLRLALAARIERDAAPTYARIARSSRLLPQTVVARLAEKAMPARLSAGVVGALSPREAAGVASRMRAAYLCDVCRHLDPRLLGPILALLPAATVEAARAELVRRADHDTMAEVVAGLTDDQVVDLVPRLGTSVLLQVTLRVSDLATLTRLAELMPVGVLRDIVAQASDPEERSQLRSLLDALPATARRRALGDPQTPSTGTG